MSRKFSLLSEKPAVQQQAAGGGGHDPLQLRRGPAAQPPAHPRVGTLRTRGERDEVGGDHTLVIHGHRVEGTKNL